MNMNTEVWNYKKLLFFRERLLNNAITVEHLTGEEIAIKPKEAKFPTFYFIAKKERSKYLIPSKIIENHELPIVVDNKVKIAVKGKAFYKVLEYRSLRIKPERTMSYKEMIDSLLPIQHLEPKQYLVWKLINDCAFDERINVEIMTYPGWMKTSLVICYGQLLSNCYCINKPSYAKLKLHLRDETQVIALDECNKMDTDESKDIADYIETTGDFRPKWINPKRASEGVREDCNINDLSTFIFYNYPDSKLEPSEQKKQLRYFNPILGHPKINRRLFSLSFDGGDDDTPACTEKFDMPKDITNEEFNFLLQWVKNKLHYSDHKNREFELRQKGFVTKHKLNNTTHDINFRAICEHLMLYADTQEMYDELETIVYNAHIKYKDFVKTMREIKNVEVEDESWDMEKDPVHPKYKEKLKL